MTSEGPEQSNPGYQTETQLKERIQGYNTVLVVAALLIPLIAYVILKAWYESMNLSLPFNIGGKIEIVTVPISEGELQRFNQVSAVTTLLVVFLDIMILARLKRFRPDEVTNPE